MPDTLSPEPAMNKNPDRWSAPPDWATATLAGRGWSARAIQGLSQTIVGGRISAAREALFPTAREFGLWQVASGSPYVVRLACDKALVVSSEPIILPAGWQSGGWFATAPDSAYTVLEIEGDALAAIEFHDGVVARGECLRALCLALVADKKTLKARRICVRL